ncbi:hypothetical protein BDY19DRAFT_946638 [Irpex rosettiformis]|uniref:Uncharacterized protein n=1 Tax=Irpex rosettiformis TaxID=378272 RepID=A0ACB8U3D4_9APHY|nr:hypothetical protein BDY19DRAFT_946638 [Irpex rosettiformis]
MSDDEGGSKKSGYRLEYATSARAKCKGPKPCSGTPITKGELRFGSLVDFRGNTSFSWRHWGCVTNKIITNMKKSFDEADELDGFDELSEEDQDRIRKAWQDGHVADEDIPDTARKPEKDEEEEDGKAKKKKKKGKSAKKTADEDEDGDSDGEEEEEKPAKKKGAAGKASKKDQDDKPGVFKFDYALSGRAKCKGRSTCLVVCYTLFHIRTLQVVVMVRVRLSHVYLCEVSLITLTGSIGKDHLRLGHERDFRGNKTIAWLHFGCVPPSLFTKLKNSCPEPTQIEGWDNLQDEDKEKVQRAWDNGSVPEDDQGPGEPRAGAPAAKKAGGKKAKKGDGEDSEPPKKKARKVKKDEDEDLDEEEEKPKAKRVPASRKAGEKKSTATTKKRTSKKAQVDDESGEDFGDAIDAVSDDDEDEPAEKEVEEEEEEEAEESSEGSKKRKRAPAPKASSSKPATKSASKAASKAASSKAATKPASRRRKQKVDDDEE